MLWYELKYGFYAAEQNQENRIKGRPFSAVLLSYLNAVYFKCSISFDAYLS